MPSLFSTLVRTQLGLMTPLIKALGLEQTRKMQDALAKLSETSLADTVTFEEIPFADFEAAWALPARGRICKAILYLHGGAYTAGTLTYAKRFGGLLAELTGRAVLCCGYRLAPEYPHPAALDDAMACYDYMLERYPANSIALVGESAGGGLCYALALRLKKEKKPLPETIVTMSPWTDLAMIRDDPELEKIDPLLSRAGLLESAQMYAGEIPLSDPLISPLYGDLEGLPPSLMYVGSDEILLQDAILMDEKLRSSGCASTLRREKGMWHAYVLYNVPEAKAAREEMAQALRCPDPTFNANG